MQSPDRVGDPLQSFYQDGPWTGDVDALKALALRAKDEAFIEVHPGLVQHQLLQLPLAQDHM